MKRYDSYKDSCVKWLGEIPSHWEVRHLRNFLTLFSEKGFGDKQLLSVTREKGVILRDKENKEENHNFVPDDLSGYKHLNKGDFVINKMKSWQGSYGVSDYEGIVSPAYFTCKLKGVNPDFFSCAIRSKAYIGFFMQYSKGIRVDQWDLDPSSMKDIPFVLPSEKEQTAIVTYLNSTTSKIEEAIAQQQKMIDLLNERKQIIINNAVTKGLNPNASMKDSGIELIGKIPAHWDVLKLKYLCSITDGTHFSPKTQPEGKKYITVSNVFDDKIDIKNANCISVLDFNSLVKQGCQPKKGDVLLAKDGTVGRTAIVNENDYVVLSSLGILSPMPNISSTFLKYMLDSDALQKQMCSLMAGSALKRITIVKISRLIGILPPIDEQKNITDYIIRQITPLNKEIDLLNNYISLLQERKQIIINDVVTGKVKVV